ncbi:MAG: hypothetical protein ACE5EE_11450 [Fidelibacterota bacterium]
MWYVWMVTGFVLGIFIIGILSSGKQADTEMTILMLKEKLRKYEGESNE